MTKGWLRYVNLSDPYERKARFLPAALSLLPLVPLSVSMGAPFLDWMKILLGGVGLGAILAVALSHAASACGNRLQESLWPAWPHDSPTNLWLRPDSRSVSSQQKTRWYQAIKSLVGLDIQAALSTADPEELRAVINDAIRALRNRLWRAPEGERLRMHNTDYGFARNLAGLRPVWLVLTAGSLVGCWLGYVRFGRPLLWAVVSSVVAVGTLAFASVLPSYVRKKAHYYAESFFEGAVALTGKTGTSTPPPEGE